MIDLITVKILIADILGFCADCNFSMQSTPEKFEAIKWITGAIAAIGFLPHPKLPLRYFAPDALQPGLNLKDYVQDPIDKAQGDAKDFLDSVFMPTDPIIPAKGLSDWILDMGRYIDAALKGQEGAAEAAVDGVNHLGDYLTGKGGK